MKKFLFTSMIIWLTLCSYSQEKPPVITNDFASVLAGDTVEVNVLLNDWCMEGHVMKVFMVFNSSVGHIEYNDSIITYSPYLYYEGIDSVKYLVKDLTNGMLSQVGHLNITVDNPGKEYLDINDISAMINASDIQFWSRGNSNPWFIVPKEGRASSVFSFSMWMGGLDENDQLHLAAERYEQVGNDFSIGPVSDMYLNQQQIDWNKLWKLNREEIEYHKNHWMDPGYLPIENIQNWPAHGDISLGQENLMAPFVDINANGIYDPENGDYPKIRGDQGMYMVYNDEMTDHTETGGNKIGVEIHNVPYAFNCPEDSVFNQSLFFHFDIINRSDTSYHDFYLGSFVDFDLGNPWDDYIGCDTVLNSFFVYNADQFDENEFFLNPDTTFGYSNSPPAQALVFLNKKMTSFMGFTNSIGIYGDPSVAAEYYNNLKGLLVDGSPITANGDRFMFPGDPANSLDWSEISAGNAPGDRRGMGASGPYEFNAGDTLQFDLAFVFARDYQGNNLTSLSLLKQRIQELINYYQNDSTPCGHSWSGIDSSKESVRALIIYPNPCDDNLFIKRNVAENDPLFLSIYEISGKVYMNVKVPPNQNKISVQNLPSGMYFIEAKNERTHEVFKFIKR